jgi:hypothetical protein
MRDRRWLTSGAAAHLISKIVGRPYGPGIVRYYESTGRLPARRTTTGVRLFREPDVRRLAEELGYARRPAAGQ